MTMSFPRERSAIEKAVRQLSFGTRAFVDGPFRDAASGKTYASINPATGKRLAEIASCDVPDATTSFGGFKQSGFFGRDKSIFTHHQYTELKTVWVQLDAKQDKTAQDANNLRHEGAAA